MINIGRAARGTGPRPVAPAERLVTFVENQAPAVKAGEYTIIARQSTNQDDRPPFEYTRRFAVAGERFAIDPAELDAVFPPDLAVGELSGVLPHVLLSRRTLPWERGSVAGRPEAPWLAVLLVDAEQAPVPVRRTAADLVPDGTMITVAGSGETGTGTLPPRFASCPGLNRLDYGEAPDDACMTIDLSTESFSSVAPSAADLPLLAHIRETDTVDTHDTAEGSSAVAVVVGNRVPRDGAAARAYLVSLENMGPLLPDDDGRPSPGLDGIRTVRLITYRWWTFTPDAHQAASFAELLDAVNAVPDGQDGPLSSLQVPFTGPRPTRAEVRQALNAQAAGDLTAADALTLTHNAFALGYVPLVHRLRRGGRTLSWYRGPLVPLPATATVSTPIPCPDAVSRYDPQTGMFDVSYAAAWQIGLLLALQNRGYALALYNWRRRLAVQAAAQVEHDAIEQALGDAFPSVLGARAARLAATADDRPPDEVVNWLAKLALLDGVPFNYLVPDERMLPPESLRVFHLDRAWIDALIDGAFSVGRITSADTALDAVRQSSMRTLVHGRRRLVRRNPRPTPPSAETGAVSEDSGSTEITGFLVRSAAVAGWPAAAAAGWADIERRIPVELLRSVRLGDDVLLVLFDGVVRAVALHEPPGQLHCGVEGAPGAHTTTLREVTGDRPGHQYDPPEGVAPVPTRADQRTIQAAACAAGMKNILNTRFAQGLSRFTSAEFALEMVQGVVEVEFRQR
ncbi:hypothetical protein [Actinomadura sp. WMMA1423]|uniref:hypothetical protein n=1 Tax=Actinomadura sp. WMMA1423 TaxID=2591108 RepID=UPI001146F03B|nr:hypothetical protein [Actinomadura sp. WMMA1423]